MVSKVTAKAHQFERNKVFFRAEVWLKFGRGKAHNATFHECSAEWCFGGPLCLHFIVGWTKGNGHRIEASEST